MNNQKQCLRCLKVFSSPQRLLSHLQRKVPCQSNPSKLENLTDIEFKKLTCQYCNALFSQKSSLIRHQKNRCQPIKKISLKKPEIVHNKPNSSVEEQLQILKEEVAELKKKPTNQVLQVISIGSTDNYLDILTEKWGNFDRALEYIKNCALSSLTGDCKLIEKVYFGGQPDEKISQPPPIYFLDKNRTNIEYFNEKKEKIRDSKETFAKKIANNLQNSYLKGINHVINVNLENRQCPNKFLEEYDLQTWNQHIYDLSDVCYQKKIINHLDIPSNGPAT